MTSAVRTGRDAQRMWPWGPLLFLLLQFPVNLHATDAASASPLGPIELYRERDFGFVIGDLVQHTISLSVDKPWVLDRAHLPAPGPVNPWLEIADIQVSEYPAEKTTGYTIQVEYQLYRGVRKTEEFEIPGFPLRVRDGERVVQAMTPASKITAVPLIPPHLANEAITPRPPVPPQLLPLETHYRIMGGLVTAIVIIALLLFLRPGFAGFRQRSHAFAAACRLLRRPRQAPPESTEFREALQTVHRAFNQTAGKTVFASRLDRFFEENPRFSPCRADTEKFFALSRQVFFGNPADIQLHECDLAWLKNLCRRYRKLERKP